MVLYQLEAAARLPWTPKGWSGGVGRGLQGLVHHAPCSDCTVPEVGVVQFPCGPVHLRDGAGRCADCAVNPHVPPPDQAHEFKQLEQR